MSVKTIDKISILININSAILQALRVNPKSFDNLL